MNSWTAVDASGLLICASVASGLRKIAFQVKAPGLHDHVHEFHKPIFTTFLSCLSNAVLGLVAISLAKLRALTARRGWKLVPNSPSAPENPFLPAEGVGEAADWASQVLVRSLTLNDIMLLIIPSCCYFLCIALAGMGMLLIPASMAFMVQSSCIVFTAACTVLAFPSRKLNNLHIRGIASCMVGVGIVSFAGYVYTLDEERRALHSLLNPPPPPESSLPPYILPPQYSLLSGAWDSELDFSQSVITASSTGGGPTMVLSTTMLVWGVLLTLLSQLAQALQFVSEEILVGRTNLHPLQMLAVEGTLSTVFSMVALGIGVLLPGKDEGGRIESLPDTLQQLGNSTPLLIICLAQFLGVAGNNYFGLRVSSAYRLSFCLVYTRYVVDLYMDNWANRLPACPPTLTGPARQS